MSKTPAQGPLAGVRVVEIAIAVTAPYASVLLGDQGAEVIKIERPGMGDLMRWVGTAVNGVSAIFLQSNRGKRSIAIDLTDPEGVALAKQLCADADVVIQNFRTGVLDRLGLGYDDIARNNPEVIYASLSGYGSTGPYAERSAYDSAIQGYAGIASVQADPDVGEPIFVRQTMADKITSLFAAQSITAALYARDKGAGGQHLELSMMDAVVSFLWLDSAGNEVLMDADGSSSSSVVGNFAPFELADGYCVVAPTSDSDFAGMCRGFGVDGYDDPAVATMAARWSNSEAMGEIIARCRANSVTLTRAEVTASFEADRVPFSMVLSPAELIDDPHAVEVGLFEEHQHPTAGPVRLPRHPTQFASTPAALGGPSPALGEHTSEILNELGLADDEARLRQTGAVS